MVNLSNEISNKMASLIQNKIIVFTSILFLCSSSLFSQTKYTLFRTKDLGENKILYYEKGEDSLVIVIKNKISIEEITSKIEDITKGKIGKKISKLNVNEETYWFYYNMKSQNEELINVGEFQPGNVKNTIFTFKSFPIFIESFNKK